MSRPIIVGLAVIALTTPAFSQRTQLTRPTNLSAIQVTPLDAQAVAFNATLAPTLTPTATSWVQSEAIAVATQQVSGDAMVAFVRRDATARFANQRATPTGIEAMVQLVLFQCAQDADADLRAQLVAMEAANAKDKSPDAMTEEQRLTLQAATQKRSQFESALSKLMKANSATSSALVSNLK